MNLADLTNDALDAEHEVRRAALADAIMRNGARPRIDALLGRLMEAVHEHRERVYDGRRGAL